MLKDLAKTYDPTIVEDKIYSNWVEKKYFHVEVDKTKEPYTIVIPPPNVTGQLHIGHAWDNTLQDILIRFKRMKGYNALWIPGSDHASISTEVKVLKKLKDEGFTKEMLGREKFLEKAWEWKELYGGKIIQQLKKLGCSCDWDRERFTMDEGLSKAVLDVFVKLYNEGLIYRGERLINWCPNCETTISDAEVDHNDKEGHFWHIKYPIKDSDGFLEIATTRPETMLGDTALAVNPQDPRYSGLIGKTVVLPILNREITVIADSYVDIEFGTGVVKITPAHDPNDFEVGKRHSLPRINIMNDNGTLNENAGPYKGYDRYEARKKIVAELKELGLLVKIENITHAVGVHERCKQVVEPLLKLQWFVKMEPLAKPAIDVYKTGELNIVPDRFGKIYLNWLENIRDWCISRQLWWGHRIPAYYCAECGHTEVSATTPEKCSKCGSTELKQDEDVLDTWFSSALWPFSTLGWPEETPEYEHFYPTSVLVTAYDIIFFWVVRMVFSGLHHTGKLPFKDVLFHGLIRDSEGKKMSKSSDNGIDPLEVIERYGADALRLTIVLGNSSGNDMRFYNEKLEGNRNFLNKIWNASRFVLMNLEGDIYESTIQTTPADRWIIGKANNLIKSVTESIEKYELGAAAQKVYDFVWDEFCDWYIEMVKTRLYNESDPTRTAAQHTLKSVLTTSLKLLHPFIPFITEEIFTHIYENGETIMLSDFPEYSEGNSYAQEEKEIDILKEAVRSIRNIRSEMNVPPSRKAKAYVVSESEDVRRSFENGKNFFAVLSYSSEVSISSEAPSIPNAITVTTPDAIIYIPFSELVDTAKEIQRLSKEKERLKSEVSRVVSKLSNEGFTKKAPASVIEEEKSKKEKYESELALVEKRIGELLI